MMVIVVIRVVTVSNFVVVLVVVVSGVVVVAMAVGSICGGHVRGPMRAVVMASMVGSSGDYWGVMLVVGSSGDYWGMVLVVAGVDNRGVVCVVAAGSGDYWSMVLVVGGVDNRGVVGVVAAASGNMVAVRVEALLLSHVLDETLEFFVLLLDEVDVRLEFMACRVVSDLYHLDLWPPLDLVLELVSLLGVFVEGVSEFFDLVSDGVLLVLGMLDSVGVD